MTPDRLANTIQDFLASCETPALLEPGERPLLLAAERMRLDVSPRGAWLEVWDDHRVWSRRILSAGVPNRKRLELEAFRFGKNNISVTLVDAADSRTAPAMEKTARSAFANDFRLFLNRHFGSWRWEAFRAEAMLEHSFSPVFPSALLTRGVDAVAAVAAPDRDTGFHVLTFALVWADYVRQWHGEIASRRLLLYLPERHAEPAVLLAQHLNTDKIQVEIWLYTRDGQEYLLDPEDRGNLRSVLTPRFSRTCGPAWWVDFLARYPNVEAVEGGDGSIGYRIFGLEFAHLTAGSGNLAPVLTYGTKRRTRAAENKLPAIAALVEEILAQRHAGGDRRHPYYTAEPEKWLEAQIRANLNEIDAQLDAQVVYSQALGCLSGERSAIDLLGIDRFGRLNILEVKASEDIHLPLQAFDYWLRVSQHLAAGDFEKSGYFPGREISSRPPRVFLVAPSLDFHPQTKAVLRFLPPECEVVTIGVNGDWRQRLDVVLRM